MFGNNKYKRFLGELGMTAASLAVAALLTLSVGCVRIETGGLSDMPLTFRTYTPRSLDGGSTKADGSYVPSGLTTLPANSSFGVFAFYQPGEVGSHTGTWSELATMHWKPNFMFNQQVNYDGSNNYSYTPLRYWPANEENTISFWAYYPYGAYVTDAENTSALKFDSGNYAASSEGLPASISYTVATDAANQQDLMFDIFANKNKTYENCSQAGVVPFTFRHALSLVRFSFGSLPEGVSLTVTDFTISNLYMAGTLTNLEPATEGAYVWTPTGSRTTSTCSAADFSSNAAAFILMPQSLVNNNDPTLEPELTITFNLTTAAADGSDPIQYSGNTGTVKLKYVDNDNHANDILAFAPGKSYLYTINVTLDAIEFSEAVESPAWATTINTNL